MYTSRASNGKGDSTHIRIVPSHPDETFFSPAGTPRILHSPILLFVLCDTIANYKGTMVQGVLPFFGFSAVGIWIHTFICQKKRNNWFWSFVGTSLSLLIVFTFWVKLKRARGNIHEICQRPFCDQIFGYTLRGEYKIVSIVQISNTATLVIMAIAPRSFRKAMIGISFFGFNASYFIKFIHRSSPSYKTLTRDINNTFVY